MTHLLQIPAPTTAPDPAAEAAVPWGPNAEARFRARIEADIAAQAAMLPTILDGTIPMVRALRLVRGWTEAQEDMLAVFGDVADDLGGGRRRLTKMSSNIAVGVGDLENGPVGVMSTVMQAVEPMAQVFAAQQINSLTRALATAKESGEMNVAERVRKQLDKALPPELADLEVPLNVDAPARVAINEGA